MSNGDGIKAEIKDYLQCVACERVEREAGALMTEIQKVLKDLERRIREEVILVEKKD